ncbi:peptidase domain-containing ABC transporter [Prosthecomicrobium sp. N25]|uniref:peptidase domain-containing ABC transporter n=1 Tax=Prosthecomicrobium sp. N25 TaxID=3129254 RepID=UPI003077AB27
MSGPSQTGPGDGAGPAAPIGTGGTAEGVRGLQHLLAQVFEARPRLAPEHAPRTPLEACLRPLLETLGWPGDHRRLFEVMPHLEPVADLGEFCAVLYRLGYRTRRARLPLARLAHESLPALLERDEGPAVLLARDPENGFLVYDGTTASYRYEPPTSRLETVTLVNPASADQEPQKGIRGTWFWNAMWHVKRPIAAVVALTFLTNLLAMTTPVYVANVYNHVISTQALESLVYFCAAISFLVAFEFHLRHMRAGLVAYVGARFHAALANAAFEKVLLLPIQMVEQSSVASQISRFRQFEGIRMFFTGHLVNALLDLPFTIIFLTALGLVGGLFVLIPIGLVVLFGVLATITIPVTRRNVAATGTAVSRSQTFLVESLSKIDTIRHLGAERLWAARYGSIARDAILNKFRAQFFDSALQAATQSLSQLAGVGTLAVGSILVMEGNLSLGGLIAVMMLIWRLLAPLQTAFLAINNLGQFADSIRQVNLLMRLAAERNPARTPVLSRSFRGRMLLDGVAYRYPGRAEPALRNVSLVIPAGQIVAISGPAGSGKSTLLKVILGFYPAAAGTIYLDGLNLQQLDPGETRVGIGYVPQDPVFFFGTLAQNLRMSDPAADEARLIEALRAAGIEDIESRFPDGLETRIRTSRLQDFSEGTLTRLALARAYVRDPSIYLFDDPGAYLDRDGDAAFVARLNELRGKATVILVTNRPSHMRACDRVIRLERGLIVADGRPEPSAQQQKSGDRQGPVYQAAG